MGRIPEQTINEIRGRVDIADLVGRYVDLRQAGRNWKGLCPFHDEKTPSFNVNSEKQIFHCFGCQAGGDAISFLMQHESLSFPEAARMLAAEYGIEVPEESAGERGLSEKLFGANEVAQRFYRSSLASREGESARAYLEERGLDAEAIAAFGLGFAPDRWDAVATALEAAGIEPEIGLQAGLLAKKRSYYDRLRGRITFPIHDVRARVVGFGGRALQADQEPKYLNTPESPIFRKRESLYGFPGALAPIRRQRKAVLCEGYFDRIALDRAGVSEALATCGTALTREHAQQLVRRTREVVLLFDGDEAGAKAVERALEILLPAGLRVSAARLPRGEDPDTYLASRGAEALRALVDASGDAIELVMRGALAEGSASPAQKADVVARLAPLVARVANPVERDAYVQRLATATQTGTAAVAAVVRGAADGRSIPDPASAGATRQPRGHDQADRHLRELALLVYRHPTVSERCSREQLGTLLPEGTWTALVYRLLDAASAGLLHETGAIDHFRLGEQLDDSQRTLLGELAVEQGLLESDRSPEQVLEDLVGHFTKKQRSARAHELTRKMKESSEPLALLQEKQRQLDLRRTARAPEPGTAP